MAQCTGNAWILAVRLRAAHKLQCWTPLVTGVHAIRVYVSDSPGMPAVQLVMSWPPGAETGHDLHTPDTLLLHVLQAWLRTGLVCS